MFRKFKKKKDPRPMGFWKAKVSHHIEPSRLKPGEKATHKVVVRNYELAGSYEFQMCAVCQGPHLSYGGEKAWEHTFWCDPNTTEDPAALNSLVLSDSVSDDKLPSVEQIQIVVSAISQSPNSAPEEKRRVHSVELVERS